MVNISIQGFLECFLRVSLSSPHLFPPTPEMSVSTAVTGSIQAHKHPSLPRLLPLKKYKTFPKLQPSSIFFQTSLKRSRIICITPEQPNTVGVFGARRGSHCLATVPELVHPRQGSDGPVPDVPGVVDLAVLHLHLGIFQPEGDVPVVHIQSTLVNGTGSGKHEYRAG